MMSIELAGVVYQIEGVLYAGEAACSLRRAGGELLTQHDLINFALATNPRYSRS